MSNAKEDVLALLADLPDTETLEDIQYHLYVMAKVRSSLETAQRQKAIPHEDVESELQAWLSTK